MCFVGGMCRKGFLHITLPYSLSLWKVRWTVERCTSRSWSRSLELLCGLSLTAVTILRFCSSESFYGLPLRNLSSTVPVVFHFLTMFLTVETDSWNVSASFLYSSPKINHGVENPLFSVYLRDALRLPMFSLFRAEKKWRKSCNWAPWKPWAKIKTIPFSSQVH